MNSILKIAAFLFMGFVASAASATNLQVGNPASLFTARTHDGSDFNLESRKGHWTVLYFYPKAGTGGCTKEAIAFRDGIDAIRALGAEVYGISTDSVEDQAAFHRENNLVFPLLADPDGIVTEMYGAKLPLLNKAKRWTFIIDPTLTVRNVEHDVDPQQDANRVVAEITRLRASSSPKP